MKGQLVSVEQLSLLEQEAMYSLLNSHFEGVRQDLFQKDLAEKNWVILIKDENSAQIKGFSTLALYPTQFEGEGIAVVYSGDTIIAPEAWSSSALPRTWIVSVNQLRQQYSQRTMYWLLICSGYRTYRFLPTFWKEFYPRYDISTPVRIEKLRQFLARRQFGNYYNQKTGIICFPHPQVLRKGLRGIPQERLKNPHIRFFREQNPGYEQGDELVCLTEISEENLTLAGRRMWFANSTNLSLP